MILWKVTATLTEPLLGSAQQLYGLAWRGVVSCGTGEAKQSSVAHCKGVASLAP